MGAERKRRISASAALPLSEMFLQGRFGNHPLILDSEGRSRTALSALRGSLIVGIRNFSGTLSHTLSCKQMRARAQRGLVDVLRKVSSRIPVYFCRPSLAPLAKRRV